ncbi:MAG: acetyl-CoA hydrolase/transferase family protein [Propionibacteriaceae bacterium]|nr:acetyl-CoA hydrolase/transferase family protein [Propionibacteriaceae bacterium]
MSTRIADANFAAKVTSAQAAAQMIMHGDKIGVSGFTGSGYPKALPAALAQRIDDAHQRGEQFTISLFTGASTAPDCDGVLAGVDGVAFRTPYQSDPQMRGKINDATSYYADVHLSHLHNQIAYGYFGKLDWAIIEVAAITADGQLIPSSAVGLNRTFLEHASRIIIEVNSWQSEELFGLHDIYYGTETMPPNRQPIPLTHPGDIIGQPTLNVDINKVAAVVEVCQHDRNAPFKPLDDDSKAIAGYLLDFLNYEVKAKRLPAQLPPLQSGVGNIANAVLVGLLDSPLENMTSFTEVIQDGMVDLIDAGKVTVASATSFSLSPEYAAKMNEHAADYRGKIVLRPQDISNNPELIRRMGVIACNGMIEADIYGNVNSTHLSGQRMQNGIGGSGDFTRNAMFSCFVSPSTAKNGAISTIVPMVSHHDHTEHDVCVIITEQGLADLRGLAPRQRVIKIIDNCAHPDYRPILHDYFDQALRKATGMQTPHDLATVFSMHQRLLATGTMMP